MRYLYYSWIYFGNNYITISNNSVCIQFTCGYNNALTINEYYNYLQSFKKPQTNKEAEIFLILILLLIKDMNL